MNQITNMPIRLYTFFTFQMATKMISNINFYKKSTATTVVTVLSEIFLLKEIFLLYFQKTFS